MKYACYLGDGAYATMTDYGLMITAGHHDPDVADAVVHIEREHIKTLLAFIDKPESMGEPIE